MKVSTVSVCATIAVFLAGCGGAPRCQEPRPYESSELGKHIEAPEGLDPLNSDREMTIPEPSPRPPRPGNAPCLDYPPSFQAAEEETEEEQPDQEQPEEESTTDGDEDTGTDREQALQR